MDENKGILGQGLREPLREAAEGSEPTPVEGDYLCKLISAVSVGVHRPRFALCLRKLKKMWWSTLLAFNSNNVILSHRLLFNRDLIIVLLSTPLGN